MQEQISKVKERRKAKIGNHVQELKTEYQTRAQKMKRAGELLNEAFGRNETADRPEHGVHVLK